MKIIKTNFFSKQVLELSKKYKKIFDDLSDFESNISNESSFDLWGGIFKYRIKKLFNSNRKKVMI